VQEQWLLSEALVLLPLTKIALRVIGYRRWHAVLGAFLPGDPQPNQNAHGPSGPSPERIAQLVHAAGREGTGTGACLERALALWWLLRRRHFPAELRLGGHQQAGRFEAHAWVQLNGAVLNDDEALIRYSPFDNPASVAGEKS
jgi:hypothetical protein